MYTFLVILSSRCSCAAFSLMFQSCCGNYQPGFSSLCVIKAIRAVSDPMLLSGLAG